MVCLLNKSRCRGVIFTWMLLSMFFEIIALYYNGIDGLGFIMWNGVRGGLTPDLFESIWHAANPEPYQAGAIYPPLIYVLLKFFLLFMSNPFPLEDRWVEMMSLTYSFDGIKVFFVYSVMVFSIMLFMVFKLCQGKLCEKGILFLYFISSAPFLYMYERGNTVFFSMFLLSVFLYFYNHGGKVREEIAVICLSAAICIKIYPVLATLIFIREKRFCMLLKCIFYSIFLLFVPFLCTGGFETCFDMLSNIQGLSSETGIDTREFGYGFKVNIENLLLALDTFVGIGGGSLQGYSSLFLASILSSVTFLASEREEAFLAVTLMMVLLPPFSWLYNVVYLFIVMIMYMNKKMYNYIDFIFLILFFGAFIPLPYGYAIEEVLGNPITWSTVVSNFSLYTMAIILVGKCFIERICDYGN